MCRILRCKGSYGNSCFLHLCLKDSDMTAINCLMMVFLIFPSLATDSSSETALTPYVEKNNSSIAIQEFQYLRAPRFPGTSGDAASRRKILQFIAIHTRYPVLAKKKGIQGTVTVVFTVEKNGTIQDVHSTSPLLGGGLEEEAIRIIQRMPKWIPGRNRGKIIPVQFTIPVKFKLPGR